MDRLQRFRRRLGEYFLRLPLNKKLIAMMLFLSLSLILTLILLYYQTEQTIYKEFEQKTSELTKAIQLGVEEVTSSGVPTEKRLDTYLRKLNAKGVQEVSIISNSDRIISSTNPKNIGKWVTRAKKELIFKAQLGEPVTDLGQFYNIIIPVVAGDTHYGYIHLTMNTEDFSSLMRVRMLKRVFAAGIVFSIGIILTVLLSRSYTKPIEEVVAVARSVAAGDLNPVISTNRQDEIGELARSVNYMVVKLREQRDLEERLRKAEHLAGIGQFSRSIAHEIRNPLNFISLSIDHIREKYQPRDADGQEVFDSIIQNIKGEITRVSRFAESFLEYGKPLELNLRMTNIRSLVDDVVQLVSPKADQERVRISVECEDIPEILVDPEFIKTCLYNIIINAFQAMPSGGRLQIRVKRSDDRVFLSVEDTGIGVSPDKIGRIFDPFFTTKPQGLGLGLALTKRVIEEHKGKVEFRSTEGVGSVVTLSLPLEEEAEHAGNSCC